jgi:phospholipid-binding lipoprotein MlaA
LRPVIPTIAVLALAAGCASSNVTPKEDRAASDPWEPLNRTSYRVHTVVDNLTLKPVAKAYKKILPSFIRRGVTNFSQNLFVPRSIVNNFLQGQGHDGLSETARFLLNSTVGIGGLIDFASMGGIEKHDETFKQTFAVWGVPQGPYVFVPIIGPQTFGDLLALPLDLGFDPLWHHEVSSTRDKVYVLRAINLRSRLLTADTLLDDSKDPYVTMRESFLQNREYEIHDGDPPMDDDFYDDFEDFEDFEDEINPSETQ